MVNLLLERVKEVIKDKGVTYIALGEGTTAGSARVSRQLNGTNPISLQTITKMLEMFPDISADWLVMGRGPKYFADNLATRVYNNGGTANIAKSISFNDRAQQKMPNGTPIDKDLIIQSQELQLQTLRDQNTILRQDNDAFRTLISKLK